MAANHHHHHYYKGLITSLSCNHCEATPRTLFWTTYRVTGLSLRGGGRGFPPATMNVFPGYFQRKIKKNRTERSSKLFDSPPTCCIYLAT